MSILEQIKVETEQAHSDALRQYRDVLGRIDSAGAGDKTKLTKLMSVLGLTVNDLANDVTAFNHAVALQHQIAAAASREQDALTAQPAASVAKEAADAALLEAKKLVAQRLQELEILVSTRAKASNDGQQIGASLAQLRSENPRICE